MNQNQGDLKHQQKDAHLNKDLKGENCKDGSCTNKDNKDFQNKDFQNKDSQNKDLLNKQQDKDRKDIKDINKDQNANIKH